MPLPRLRTMLFSRLLFGLFLSTLATAQDPWTPYGGEPVHDGSVLTFDSSRGRAVYHEATTGITREWDGSTWEIRAHGGPTAQEWGDTVLAYDANANLSVLFNGRDGTTWGWDGASWSMLASTGPGSRRSAAFAFDSARNRAVLHGGEIGPVGYATAQFNDTWEWDGSVWSQVSTSGPQTAFASMTFDAARNRILMFGGSDLFGLSRLSTWEWDGSTWTRVSTAGPLRGQGSMAYDSSRNRTVLSVPGASLFFNSPETWEWDGSAWTLVTTGTGAQFTSVFTMTYDPVRSVVLGLETVESLRTVTWDGASWTTVARRPLDGVWSGFVFDRARGRSVLIGERGTWEYDGASWTGTATGAPFEDRFGPAIAYDPVRARTVLFGGTTQATRFGDDTWEWDGNAWSQVAVGLPAPPGRRLGSMAHDPVGGGAILFGGNGAGSLGTWRWDGTAWTSLNGADPGPRELFALATDERRGRIVLHGGFNVSRGGLGDTWEWDGARWMQVATTGPGIRWSHSMAYDPIRGRVVIHAGNDSGGRRSDTWEWDGRVWSRIAASSTSRRRDHVMTFDRNVDRVVVFGGSDGASPSSTLPAGGYRQLEFDRIGTGCPGSAGSPSLELASARPPIGGTLRADLTSIPVGQAAAGLIGFGLRAPGVALDAIGMTGCELHVIIAAQQPLVPAGGTANWSLPIPNNPTLVDLNVWLQCAVVDAAANGLGITLSNATVAVLRP